MSDSETPSETPLEPDSDSMSQSGTPASEQDRMDSAIHRTSTAGQQRPASEGSGPRQNFASSLRQMLSGAFSFLGNTNGPRPNRSSDGTNHQNPLDLADDQSFGFPASDSATAQQDTTGRENSNENFFRMLYHTTVERSQGGQRPQAGPMDSDLEMDTAPDPAGSGFRPAERSSEPLAPMRFVSVLISMDSLGGRNASEAAIASLKSVALSELPSMDDLCPICYEKYEDVRQPPTEPLNSDSDTLDVDHLENSHPDQTESSQSALPRPQAASEPVSAMDHSPLAMPCGHVFGKACLRTWLDSEASCPMCRHRLEQAHRAPPDLSGVHFPSLAEILLLAVGADALFQDGIPGSGEQPSPTGEDPHRQRISSFARTIFRDWNSQQTTPQTEGSSDMEPHSVPPPPAGFDFTSSASASTPSSETQPPPRQMSPEDHARFIQVHHERMTRVMQQQRQQLRQHLSNFRGPRNLDAETGSTLRQRHPYTHSETTNSTRETTDGGLRNYRRDAQRPFTPPTSIFQMPQPTARTSASGRRPDGQERGDSVQTEVRQGADTRTQSVRSEQPARGSVQPRFNLLEGGITFIFDGNIMNFDVGQQQQQQQQQQQNSDTTTEQPASDSDTPREAEGPAALLRQLVAMINNAPTVHATGREARQPSPSGSTENFTAADTAAATPTSIAQSAVPRRSAAMRPSEPTAGASTSLRTSVPVDDDGDLDLLDQESTDDSATSQASSLRRRGPNRSTSHQRSHPYTR